MPGTGGEGSGLDVSREHSASPPRTKKKIKKASSAMAPSYQAKAKKRGDVDLEGPRHLLEYNNQIKEDERESDEDSLRSPNSCEGRPGRKSKSGGGLNMAVL